jgi:hypothetical protein
VQLVEQVPLLHALWTEQSVFVTQPQVPPGRHAWPFIPMHSMHAPPTGPHAPGLVTVMHAPRLQHPPLQIWPPEQLMLQVWLPVVSHA